MKILTISGSTRLESSNARFLSAFAKTYPEHTWVTAPSLADLPMFTPETLAEGRTGAAAVLAKAVKDADLIMIATPEYAHNMPAALKSALEWLVASGEFWRKPTVAITCTPHAPRGEKCMQSLVWTLQALDAKVIAEMPVYDVGKKLDDQGKIADEELCEMMDALMQMATAG